MKRIVTLFVILFSAVAVNAQQPTLTPSQERAHVVTVRMNKIVALSEDQFAKVEAVNQAKFSAIELINANAAKTKQEKEAEIAQVVADKDKEIQAILTPEQWTKYQQAKEDKKKRKAAAGQTE